MAKCRLLAERETVRVGLEISRSLARSLAVCCAMRMPVMGEGRSQCCSEAILERSVRRILACQAAGSRRRQ